MRGLSSVTHLCARLLVGVTLAAPIGCEDDTSVATDDDDRSPAPAEPVEIAQRVAEPVEPAPPGTSVNLLQWAATRDPLGADEPERTWRLPMKSKRIDVSLLRAAAMDDVEALAAILTPDAQWGLPDRRMPGARPVFAKDNGDAFLAALRKAAARLPDKPQWETDMLMPGTTTAVRLGAEPMWSYFKQGWETILIRKVHRDGRAWIDYVGFFEELPAEPIKIDVKSWGYPPPSSPAWKMPDGSIRIPPKQRPRIDMRPPEGPSDD